MQGFVVLPDGFTGDPADPDAGLTIHAHPSSALMAVQEAAATSPSGSAVLMVLDVPGAAAMCGACLVRVGGVHDCAPMRGRPVMPTEAVLRRAETAR